MSHPNVEKLTYRDGDTTLEAHVAIPAGSGRLPAVLVCHAWAGQGEFERAKAERIAAELGYVGAAIDVYGRGVFGRSVEENAALMQPWMKDRGALRRRLLAGVEAVAAHPRVDRGRLAAIGFCFGGLCVLDLARSGADLRGVVAFHGLFSPPTGLSVGPIRAKVLALHGHDDPMATPEQLLAFEREMSEHGADWEVHVYGGTVHAFTNPNAADPARGTVYSARADRRSWIAMKHFLEEIFE
jgi:dienelactone hydrolase